MIQLRESEGVLCPVFICDHCGDPIQGEQVGLIQWNTGELNDTAVFMTLHKGPQRACARIWDKDKHGSTTWAGWRPLEKFADQLAYNTRHPFTGDAA